MGGKTWQQDEEELFWLELIPQSPEGLDPGQRKYSWKEIAGMMHQRLGPKGYRNYNHQLIYEHFYQNCKSNHPSPRARGFVRDYMQRRGNKPIERPKEPKPSKDRTPVKRRTASGDAGHSEVKRVRHGCEEVEDRRGAVAPNISAYRYPSLSAPYRGEVAHAASQTVPFDGHTINPYWSPRRIPLPFAPRLNYGTQYPGSPTTTNAQDGTSMANHETPLVLPGSKDQQSDSPSVTGDLPLSRTNPLPPLTMEPRIEPVTRLNAPSHGTRTPLPSISSLRSSIDAPRPPKLEGIVTPKYHGPMFEALLSAASASSAEPSPNSMFSRSESFNHSRPGSPATTVIDDNAAGTEKVEGFANGKTAAQPAQVGEQHVVSE